MRRRLAALLLALSVVLGVSVSAPPPAQADGISAGIRLWCNVSTAGMLFGLFDGKHGDPKKAGVCRTVGDLAGVKVKDEWKKVQGSLLGDVIASAVDSAKWTIKTVLTVALIGPSLDLDATGLWKPPNSSSDPASIAGMLAWLGLVFAVLGFMWQLGKMAVTGQIKHAGRAMVGWVENVVLSAVGVSLFVILLKVGDAISAGLVNQTFKDNEAYERVIAVLIPVGVANPVNLACIVGVLLLVGFVNLVMAFLRLSAIPLVCLLLPVAGAGRVGGDATRQWAPKLITAGMVIVAGKPIVAVIICTGFAEFGKSGTLAEWLRGFATLLLAAIAPGPLTKIFAPLGAAMGAGMSAGGARGALVGAAGLFAGREKAHSTEGEGPTSAVQHAHYVQRQRAEQDTAAAGTETEPEGNAAQVQAARNQNNKIPAQTTGTAEPTGATTPEGSTAGTAVGAATKAPRSAGAAGTAVTAGIQIIDGVNDAVQHASSEAGGGSQP